MSLNFYKCQSCGHTFPDGDGKRVKDHLGVTDPYPVYVTYIGCPECECEDLDDWSPCEGCDENEALEGEDYCAECICKEGCQVAEHKGYRDCRETGQCQNNPRHVPASSVPTGAVEGEGLPERDGRGGALLLMLAITVACALMGD